MGFAFGWVLLSWMIVFAGDFFGEVTYLAVVILSLIDREIDKVPVI